MELREILAFIFLGILFLIIIVFLVLAFVYTLLSNSLKRDYLQRLRDLGEINSIAAITEYNNCLPTLKEFISYGRKGGKK